MYILLNNKLFPQILKLFILVVFIFFIYFSNYIKGKEFFANNIQYNQNNTNNIKIQIINNYESKIFPDNN